jgi:spore germination protein GerM
MHPRLTSLLLATALGGASLTACGGDDEAVQAAGSPTTASATVSATPSAPATASPSPSTSPSASASPAVQTTAVAVYYLRDTGPTGPRLYREFHRRPVTDDPARDAVEAMLEQDPDDDDYTSLWPAGTGVNDVSIDGSAATVDLTPAAAKGQAGSDFEAATLQQLVHTVTAAVPSVKAVRVLIDGERAETLWGHVDITEPVRRAPAAEILGPVWVLEPTEGATLARGDSFGGEASVFEATVNWEWVQGDTVVAKGFSTAAEGAPGRGPWSATVDVPPGDYELRAFESSAKDGSPIFVDTKTVTVTD